MFLFVRMHLALSGEVKIERGKVNKYSGLGVGNNTTRCWGILTVFKFTGHLSRSRFMQACWIHCNHNVVSEIYILFINWLIGWTYPLKVTTEGFRDATVEGSEFFSGASNGWKRFLFFFFSSYPLLTQGACHEEEASINPILIWSLGTQ